MNGKVYAPLVGGLVSVAIGVRQLVSGDMPWLGAGVLVCGIAALALAFFYWRGSRVQGS